MVIINQIGKLLVEAPTGVWEKIIMAFNSNIANYALAIICMTLVIKLVLFPFDFLNRKFTRKSTKMQAEIQPEIDVLKKKYGNNQKELNAKTMEVYKKHNYNVGGTCLVTLITMVLTMVVFFTLFAGLNKMSSYKVAQQYEDLRLAYYGVEKVEDIASVDISTLNEEEARARVLEEYKAKKVKVRLRAIGKKGIEFFNFQGIDILEGYRGVSSMPTYEKAQSIIDEAIKDFNSGATDKIIMVHNGYKNMISQEIRIKDIVPVQMPLDMANTEKFDSLMEVEPSNEDDTIIGELLKKYLEYGMYYSLIDSLAAEHCSRMQAMDNASKNAKAKVKELDLAYNKARQGNITTELIEIISGVESMK